MIGMLDTWERSHYCTRIWTVFEQYTAAKLGVKVQMILPPAQMNSFKAAMQRGSANAVTQNLTQIDVEHARASVPEDEVKLRALIQQHSSFDEVNKTVEDSMVKWCDKAFAAFLQSSQVSVHNCHCILHLVCSIVGVTHCSLLVTTGLPSGRCTRIRG